MRIFYSTLTRKGITDIVVITYLLILNDPKGVHLCQKMKGRPTRFCYIVQEPLPMKQKNVKIKLCSEILFKNKNYWYNVFLSFLLLEYRYW
jgi:hypothetical protein